MSNAGKRKRHKKAEAPLAAISIIMNNTEKEEDGNHCDDKEGGPGACPAFQRFNTLHPGVDKESLTKPQTKKSFQKGLLPSAQGSLLLGSPEQSLQSIAVVEVAIYPP